MSFVQRITYTLERARHESALTHIVLSAVMARVREDVREALAAPRAELAAFRAELDRARAFMGL